MSTAGLDAQDDVPFPRLVVLHLLPGAVQMVAYALFAAFVPRGDRHALVAARQCAAGTA